MTGTIGTLQVGPTLATLAQTTQQNNFFRRFVSPPLAAQTGFSSSTAAFEAGCVTSNATNSPWFFRGEIYIWRPSSGAKIATLLTELSGLSTSGALATETGQGTTGVSLSSTTWLDGDVLIMEVWGNVSQGMATSYTWTFDYDGTTEPTTGVAATSAASYFDVGSDLPLFVPSAFMPRASRPTLQAVNRSNTY